MRYPNRRYGNPTEMAYYAMSYGSTAHLAKALRRSERSVKDWLSGKKRVPWWVPEVLRLQKMEHDDTLRQITGRQTLARLGVVTEHATIIDAGHRFKPELVEPTVEEQIDLDGMVQLRKQG